MLQPLVQVEWDVMLRRHAPSWTARMLPNVSWLRCSASCLSWSVTSIGVITRSTAGLKKASTDLPVVA